MKFEVETGYERRPSPLKFEVSLSEPEGPPETIGEELFQRKRTLSLRVAVNFWSNDAQISQKAEQAERTARAYLFKDMLPIVEQIKLEANSEEVFDLAGRLKAAMLGKPESR